MRSEAEIRADVHKWCAPVSMIQRQEVEGRLLADVEPLLAEVVRLRGVIDGVRVIRAKVGDDVESDALGLFVSWLRDQLDDLLAAADVPVPVVPDYTDDGEQDNAIDGLMRHVGMPRPHGKHYVVDERADVTDDPQDEAKAQRAADYQSGRWCGECRHRVIEDPPCCYSLADFAPALPDVQPTWQTGYFCVCGRPIVANEQVGWMHQTAKHRFGDWQDFRDCDHCIIEFPELVRPKPSKPCASCGSTNNNGMTCWNCGRSDADEGPFVQPQPDTCEHGKTGSHWIGRAHATRGFPLHLCPGPVPATKDGE